VGGGAALEDRKIGFASWRSAAFGALLYLTKRKVWSEIAH
jgi:hypothetical protein